MTERDFYQSFEGKVEFFGKIFGGKDWEALIHSENNSKKRQK